MSWTTPQDVQNAWIEGDGDPAPDDTDLLQKWIDRAERKIRREVHDIGARLAVPDTDPAHEPDLAETVKDVVCSMVERKFRNPEGVRTEQDNTGPLGGSRTFGGDQPGELWITPKELADLQSAPSGRSKAFSIDTLPEREQHPLAHSWVNGPDGYAPGTTA